MNFIKNIMGGNRQDPDNVNVEEVAALIDDVDAKDTSKADAFNKLAQIQSRIKGTQSEPADIEGFDADDEFEDADLEPAEQIRDFADVVRDKSNLAGQDKAQIAHKNGVDTTNGPNGAALAPIMTEDDFSQLDDELSRMSDALEEQEAVQNQPEPVSRAVEKSAEIPKQQPGFPNAENGNATLASPKTAKVFEAVKELKTSTQPKPATFMVSEKQGGGSLPVADTEPKRTVEPTPKPVPSAQAMPPTQPTLQPETTRPIRPATPTTSPVAAQKEMVPVSRPAVEEPMATKPEMTNVAPAAIEVPKPAAGRSGRRAGRVKTRLLGFEHATEKDSDPFGKDKETVSSNQIDFPVGWMVVVGGPGYGTTFAIFNGVSQIGRGEDQAIKLDFGDNSISRENHAAVAFDGEQNKFFLGHGGKANLVRLNDSPVLSTEEINNSDIIRIGETTLRFVALCGENFNWNADGKEDQSDAAIA